MTRRNFLLFVALLLVGANIAFFASRSAENPTDEATNNGDVEPEESAARWIAYMPSFELSQRSNPESYGVHDPPPFNNVMEQGRSVSTVAMVAGECAIVRYTVRTSGDFEEYMPNRLFAENLSVEQQECLREMLPDGYRLLQLAEPVRPSTVSWLIDPVSLASEEGTNAQTH